MIADIDDVDQAAQAGRGVLAEADVHVDAAGGVCAPPPASRMALTTSCTISMSSQRHTGLTTSAQGSVTEASRSTTHLRFGHPRVQAPVLATRHQRKR